LKNQNETETYKLITETE